jgi:Histidine kinase-, DNA gyrase B-, and HSP90-like ATPase
MLGNTLSVTSHVGRDLLQSSGLFKHEHAVAWEYASNGLQYVDPGTNPVVRVTIDQSSKLMTISDNGRGMSFDDLEGYFTMHGENADRKLGRPGRGMFGTGKSAAFGIANRLRVTTIRRGLRSIVELDRATIDSPQAKTHVPVNVVEQGVPVLSENGTVVEIIDINLKRIDVQSIIREIEKHIAHWPNATVFVNHHQCQYIEPATASVERIQSAASPFASELPDENRESSARSRATRNCDHRNGCAVRNYIGWM